MLLIAELGVEIHYVAIAHSLLPRSAACLAGSWQSRGGDHRHYNKKKRKSPSCLFPLIAKVMSSYVGDMY